MAGGDAAVAMEVSILNGGGFPAGVQDTPANRALFAQIKEQIDAAPRGMIADVPWDYTGDDGPQVKA